jgi:hypothetical protein
MQQIRTPFNTDDGITSASPIVNTNTDYNIPASGTSAQRPTPAVNKATRLNTDTSRQEYYLNGKWNTIATIDDVEDISFLFAAMLA